MQNGLNKSLFKNRMLKILIKSTITFVILIYIISITDINKLIHLFNIFKFVDFLIPLLLIFIQVLLTAERWRQVSIILGHRFTINFAIRIQLVGLFFNQILPSTIGGDAYRIWQIKSKIGGFQDAINSIIGDRVVAFFSLLILISINILLLNFAISYYLIIYLIMLMFVIFIFKFKKYRFKSYQYLESINFFQPLTRFIYSIDSLFISRKFILLVIISFIIHIMSSLIFFDISNSLNLDISINIFLIITPLILIITHLPISIGGWGVREGSMIFFLSRVGVHDESALAISIFTGLIQMLAGFFGGIIWIIYKEGETDT